MFDFVNRRHSIQVHEPGEDYFECENSIALLPHAHCAGMICDGDTFFKELRGDEFHVLEGVVERLLGHLLAFLDQDEAIVECCERWRKVFVHVSWVCPGH